MKKCFKCNEVKGMDAFYKHKGMADGYLNKCIECAKKDVGKHRIENIEKIRDYDRNRKRSTSDIEKNRKRSISYRKGFPERYKAVNAVNNALKSKRIIKKPCAVCGATERLEAHHFDYSKQLEVIWLCSAHHSAVHYPKISPF